MCFNFRTLQWLPSERLEVFTLAGELFNQRFLSLNIIRYNNWILIR